MSSLYMRTQPYDTKPPTEPGMLVPWMAYSPPASVIAATPIGLRGDPPGMTSGIDGLSCLTSFGGDQAGLRYLPALVGLHHDRPRRIVAPEADHIRPRLGRGRHQRPRPDRGRQRHRNPQRH